MMPPDIDNCRDTNVNDDMDDNILNKCDDQLQTALSKMPFVVERPFSCFIGSSSIEDVMKCPSERLNFIDGCPRECGMMGCHFGLEHLVGEQNNGLWLQRASSKMPPRFV